MTQWNRKDQHVHLAEMQRTDLGHADFNDIRFVHHSFSNMAVADVDLTTKLGPFHLSSPFFINAMTGGSPKTKQINQNLAILARDADLAMAVGSVSAAIADSTLEDSFKIVRQTNPNGLIFANLGAHHSVENAKRVVTLLEADALQIHLNIPQEIVMPEGDRDFSGWLKNVEKITKELSVPVIVKEVGFGMSQKTIQQLLNVGVTIIDVSGRGGTNFIQIENERRKAQEYNYLYEWGQSTVESLLEASSFAHQADFIASGGIKNPLHMVKAIRLGASAIGISGEFLHMVLTNSNDLSLAKINSWNQELKGLLTLLEVSRLSDIRKAEIILSPNLLSWCQQRNIPISLI
ncbi:type 2 isopentenyl-diphosphate Delta-isomerase [Vagococcus vulneris]|uniref:Isopentenyl-diphosphate delta-isomerase n=1 Tax=Vagococcus vulneris TaxID=1977869 RepID=A0A429ZXN1_9ENTE|nr:type 2 isopentenyl-diphosphate Delta-isomerase [Vagococcus vulneris]RST98700.1 type 2 isopentenyl-diphosphate Delta-isomerase [Vagococcus vulneris]